MSERCSRGHVIASYADVDTFCVRCIADLDVAVDLLRRLLDTSDPLPPDGIDVQVEVRQFLDGPAHDSAHTEAEPNV